MARRHFRSAATPVKSAGGAQAGERVEAARVTSPDADFQRDRSFLMGSTADKVNGAANEAMGKVKQGVGAAVGSDKMRAEGAAQELKGKVESAVGDAKSAAKDAANKAAEAANRNL
jgi:uncharacterized protein YjbJ (UPF0337 family)